MDDLNNLNNKQQKTLIRRIRDNSTKWNWSIIISTIALIIALITIGILIKNITDRPDDCKLEKQIDELCKKFNNDIDKKNVKK